MISLGKYSYNVDEYRSQFVSSGMDKKLEELFGSDVNIFFEPAESLHSPRDWAMKKMLNVESLFYISFLADLKPTTVIDLGCGGNVFKTILNHLYGLKVHGIDPLSVHADEKGQFDDYYVNSNKDSIESIMAINSCHFTPIYNVCDVITKFRSTIAPGGRGYIALNTQRMIERTPAESLNDIFGTISPEPSKIKTYVVEKLESMNMNFLVCDVFVGDRFQTSNHIDGNIRIVLEKL